MGTGWSCQAGFAVPAPALLLGCVGNARSILAGVWREEQAPRVGLDPARPPRARTGAQGPLLCSEAAASLDLGLPAGTIRAQVCRAEVGPDTVPAWSGT